MAVDPKKVAEIIEHDKYVTRTMTIREEYENSVRAAYDAAWAIANDDPWTAVSMYLDEGERGSEIHKPLGLALRWRAALELSLAEARMTADELQAAVDEARRTGNGAEPQLTIS